METLEQQFNSRVRVFLGRTGVSPTTFGMKALGDAHLMHQIDGGRSLSLRTADRVLAFVADYDLDSGGPRTPPRGHRRRKPSSRARRTRRSRAMTEQPIEQRTNPPTRFLRLPEVQARTGSTCGWPRGASPGRSRWVRARWAGSRRRWTSGSASGSRQAGVSPQVPSTAPREGGPGGHSLHLSPGRRGAGRGGGAMIGRLRARDRALGSFGWTARTGGSALGIVHLRLEKVPRRPPPFPPPIRIELRRARQGEAPRSREGGVDHAIGSDIQRLPNRLERPRTLPNCRKFSTG